MVIVPTGGVVFFKRLFLDLLADSSFLKHRCSKSPPGGPVRPLRTRTRILLTRDLRGRANRGLAQVQYMLLMQLPKEFVKLLSKGWIQLFVIRLCVRKKSYYSSTSLIVLHNEIERRTSISAEYAANIAQSLVQSSTIPKPQARANWYSIGRYSTEWHGVM